MVSKRSPHLPSHEVRCHGCSVTNPASDFHAHVLGRFRRNRGSNPEGVESPGGVGISLQNRHAASFIRNRQRALSSARRLSVIEVESSNCQSTQRCLGGSCQAVFSRVQIQNADAFPSFAKTAQLNAKGKTNRILPPRNRHENQRVRSL